MICDLECLECYRILIHSRLLIPFAPVQSDHKMLLSINSFKRVNFFTQLGLAAQLTSNNVLCALHCFLLAARPHLQRKGLHILDVVIPVVSFQGSWHPEKLKSNNLEILC